MPDALPTRVTQFPYSTMIARFRFGVFCLIGWLIISAAAAAAEVTSIKTYYIPDRNGSPLAAADEAGNQLWEQRYTPYGYTDESQAPASSTVLNRIGFTGHAEDKLPGLKLVYMQARFYDPAIGRFLGMDPHAVDPLNPFSFNRYAYANNNPYAYVDRNGEIAFLIPIAMFIAKEIAAEVASRATHGATDFLSVRRVATRAGRASIRYIGKKFSRGKGADGTKSVPKPLLGKNPTLGKNKNRVNTDLEGGTATAKSIFRNQTKGQKITQQPLGPKGGVRRIAEDGTQIRLPNNGGGARVDLPGRGSAGRETIHFTP